MKSHSGPAHTMMSYLKKIHMCHIPRKKNDKNVVFRKFCVHFVIIFFILLDRVFVFLSLRDFSHSFLFPISPRYFLIFLSFNLSLFLLCFLLSLPPLDFLLPSSLRFIFFPSRFFLFLFLFSFIASFLLAPTLEVGFFLPVSVLFLFSRLPSYLLSLSPSFSFLLPSCLMLRFFSVLPFPFLCFPSFLFPSTPPSLPPVFSLIPVFHVFLFFFNYFSFFFLLTFSPYLT